LTACLRSSAEALFHAFQSMDRISCRLYQPSNVSTASTMLFSPFLNVHMHYIISACFVTVLSHIIHQKFIFQSQYSSFPMLHWKKTIEERYVLSPGIPRVQALKRYTTS